MKLFWTKRCGQRSDLAHRHLPRMLLHSLCLGSFGDHMSQEVRLQEGGGPWHPHCTLTLLHCLLTRVPRIAYPFLPIQICTHSGTSLTVQLLPAHFQCRGHGFYPWPGNLRSYMLCGVVRKLFLLKKDKTGLPWWLGGTESAC